MNKQVKKFREKGENSCYYCKEEIMKEECKTVDHKDPLARGGKNNKDNLVIACSTCNVEKGEMNEREYIIFLSYKKFLTTLTREKLEEKEKMFVSLFRKNQMNETLKRRVGRKMKALRAIKKREEG